MLSKKKRKVVVATVNQAVAAVFVLGTVTDDPFVGG